MLQRAHLSVLPGADALWAETYACGAVRLWGFVYLPHAQARECPEGEE